MSGEAVRNVINDVPCSFVKQKASAHVNELISNNVIYAFISNLTFGANDNNYVVAGVSITGI